MYLLRHEERNTNDISFDAPLTDHGLNKARTEVCDTLASLHIDIIYCSPYLRTLQTIEPFCQKNGRTVNLDWSIAEVMPATAKYYAQFETIVNAHYRSFTPYQVDTNGPHQPHFELLVEQVAPFLDSLDSSKNILLVTHMPIMNVIMYLKGHQEVQLYTERAPGTVMEVPRT